MYLKLRQPYSYQICRGGALAGKNAVGYFDIAPRYGMCETLLTKVTLHVEFYVILLLGSTKNIQVWRDCFKVFKHIPSFVWPATRYFCVRIRKKYKENTIKIP